MTHLLTALAGALTLAALASLSSRGATARARLVQIASLCAFSILALGWFAAARLMQAGLGLPAMAWSSIAAAGAVSWVILRALEASMPRDTRPSPLSPLWRRRLAHGLAAILLISVAGIQIARSQLGGLARWKGGGFGMFSAIEERFIRAEVTVGARTAPGVGWDQSDLRKRLKPLKKNPDPEALQKLAFVLASRRWSPLGRRGAAKTPKAYHMLAPRSTLRGKVPDAIRLQSWDVAFDKGELTPVLLDEVGEEGAQGP